MIKANHIKHLLLLLACALWLTACGGGGGDRQTVGLPIPPSSPIALGDLVTGTLTAADAEDAYSVDLTAGHTYSLELFAARANQAEWNSNDNIPLLKIWQPGAEPNTIDLYLDHDYSGAFDTFSWFDYGWGKHDLDIPQFLAPVGGTWYISVSNDDQLAFGSDYILRLTDNGTFPSSKNDTADDTNTDPAFPFLLNNTGDVVYDHYTSGTSNFYKFTILAPTIACFDVTAFRNGRFKGDGDYFDPTLALWDEASIQAWDGTAAGRTPFIEGLIDSDVDDYYFADPGFCYRVDAGNYYLEVTENFSSGSSDYFLTYTANNSAVAEAGPDNSAWNAPDTQALTFGNVVTGDIGTAGDLEDWYAFDALPGDMIQLQLFDNHNDNTVNALGAVSVELRRPSNNGPLAASGPNEVTPGSNIFTADGPGAFTVRALVDPGALNVTASPLTYYVKISSTGTATSYSFKLERLRAAFVDASRQTIEDSSVNNNLPGNAQMVDRDGQVAYVVGNMDAPSGDVDFFKFQAFQGSLVTLNVYAKGTVSNHGVTPPDKVHDLSGFGSTLEPRIKVYKSTNTVDPAELITSAEYISTTPKKVLAESITTPRPSLSVAFVAPLVDPNPGVIGATYYFSIESTDPANTTDANYFIEVIKSM